ncbi:MAG: TIGR00730 family Rossman fold protein [Bacteroidota bacterium]
MKNKRAAVYCASSRQVDEKYLSAAESTGRLLAKNNIDIIYGGGKIGLMGKVADGALSEGGTVIGILPHFMKDLELGHEGLTELRIVESMHQRQHMMAMESDYVITLPGGCGTLLETFEAISWKKLGLIISPIIIYNQDGYYDALVEMLKRAIDEKFMSDEHYAIWKVADTPEGIIDIINKSRIFV